MRNKIGSKKAHVLTLFLSQVFHERPCYRLFLFQPLNFYISFPHYRHSKVLFSSLSFSYSLFVYSVQADLSSILPYVCVIQVSSRRFVPSPFSFAVLQLLIKYDIFVSQGNVREKGRVKRWNVRHLCVDQEIHPYPFIYFLPLLYVLLICHRDAREQCSCFAMFFPIFSIEIQITHRASL